MYVLISSSVYFQNLTEYIRLPEARCTTDIMSNSALHIPDASVQLEGKSEEVYMAYGDTVVSSDVEVMVRE
jgi:hypothetical protein